MSKPLSDLPARLKWMDEQKIERQVVGGWLDMFGYEVPAEEGAAWSRLINTHLAQTAMREPRFVPLATVPLQDGARAAEVLREAHAAGFKGTMIGTQPKGKGGVLDDPALTPFWEAANELGSVVFIHPVFESGDDRVHDYGMANAVGPHHRYADRDVAADLCRATSPAMPTPRSSPASAARRCLM